MSSRSRRASWRGSRLWSGQSHGYISGVHLPRTLDNLAEDARGCHFGWWYDVLFTMMPCFHLFGRFNRMPACVLQCSSASPDPASALGARALAVSWVDGCTALHWLARLSSLASSLPEHPPFVMRRMQP